MVMPGATMRNPRVNRLLCGWRTALTVCQAIIIAITVVFAGTGSEFQRETGEFRVGVVVGVRQVLEEPLTGLACVRRHLRQPDRCLDRLDLTEEGSDSGELVISPVLQQTCRLRRYPPLLLRQHPPLVDLIADTVDQCGVVVLLLFGRESLPLVEDNLLLSIPPLPRLRNRCDELRPPSSLDNFLRRLARLVQLPVAGRVEVRRIENRLFEESVRHRILGLGVGDTG